MQMQIVAKAGQTRSRLISRATGACTTSGPRRRALLLLIFQLLSATAVDFRGRFRQKPELCRTANTQRQGGAAAAYSGTAAHGHQAEELVDRLASDVFTTIQTVYRSADPSRSLSFLCDSHTTAQQRNSTAAPQHAWRGSISNAKDPAVKQQQIRVKSWFRVDRSLPPPRYRFPNAAHSAPSFVDQVSHRLGLGSTRRCLHDARSW